jgi:hypothetical protein
LEEATGKKRRSAQEVLTALRGALDASNVAQACHLVARLGPQADLREVLDEDEIAGFLMMASESALYGGAMDELFVLRRQVELELMQDRRDRQRKVEVLVRARVLNAEFARLWGQPADHLVAVSRALEPALEFVACLPPLSRYIVVWEVVELLAACGLRERAGGLALRLSDFAARHLQAQDALESRILAHHVALDLPGLLGQAMAIELPRLAADERPAPPGARAHAAVAGHVEVLQSLERQAQEAGRPGWALRAGTIAGMAAWTLGGGRDPGLRSGSSRWLDWTAQQGIHSMLPERRLAVEWSALACAPGREEAEDQLVSIGRNASGLPPVESLYLAAAAGVRAGREGDALRSYGRFAAAAMKVRRTAEQAIDSEVHAQAELLLAIPLGGGTTGARVDDVRLAASAVSISISRGSRALSQVAQRQGVTARRIQQVFKNLGLPTPARFFRQLHGPD